MARAKAAAAALPSQNVLDRVIAYIDPKRGQQRMMARTSMAIIGGYNGARRDKSTLATWNPASGSPTTDAVADLPVLRDRSRDEIRNSAVASGALAGMVAGTVGTGLSATPDIDFELLGLTEAVAKAWCRDARRRFEFWAGSEDVDIARELDFYDHQELGLRSAMESGDSFVLTPETNRPGRGRQLALQLIEGDRVCNPGRAANSDTLIEGLEVDPATLEVVAAHFARRHPGDMASGANAWERRPIRGATTGERRVLHIFKTLRPGLKRGIPMLAPVLEPLKQLGRWTENELNAAVTSSLFSVFAKMDPEAFQDIFDGDGESEKLLEQRSNWSGKLESGKVINLLPGEDVGSVSSTRPNPEFDPFWSAIVRQIGMALEVPQEVLVMHFSTSYTAARGAMLVAWRTFKTRRDWLAKKFCQPVYELWLSIEVAEGRIAAPGFFADPMVRAAWSRCLWTGDGPGSLDPVKEVQAAKERVELGTSTLNAESLAHDGVDWATKHRQRVVEVTARRVDGVAAANGTPAVAAPVDAAKTEDGAVAAE